eukprot:scaffold42272_cov25-Prasinocladus_malaysianus.AAC.7
MSIAGDMSNWFGSELYWDDSLIIYSLFGVDEGVRLVGPSEIYTWPPGSGLGLGLRLRRQLRAYCPTEIPVSS